VISLSGQGLGLGARAGSRDALQAPLAARERAWLAGDGRRLLAHHPDQPKARHDRQLLAERRLLDQHLVGEAWLVCEALDLVEAHQPFVAARLRGAEARLGRIAGTCHRCWRDDQLTLDGCSAAARLQREAKRKKARSCPDPHEHAFRQSMSRPPRARPI
jgi:hypothetical protein